MFYVIVIWGDLMNTYGSRIKAARESANLTQEGLGQKLGVTGVTIMRYEKNQREPRQDQFKRLAAALNVDVNWLMNGYTLEQRDQRWKDFVAQRFREARIAQGIYDKEKILEAIEIMAPTDIDSSNLFKNEPGYKALVQIDEALAKLNCEGQQEAVKRVEELTEIPRYQATAPQPPTETTPQPPPRDETPGRGTDTTPPPEGAEEPGEGE